LHHLEVSIFLNPTFSPTNRAFDNDKITRQVNPDSQGRRTADDVDVPVEKPVLDSAAIAKI
jgi:hypothetical protein